MSLSPAPSGQSTQTWYNTTVQMDFQATDPGTSAGTASGVNARYYSIDQLGCYPQNVSGCLAVKVACPGGACKPVQISTEGLHTISYFSADIAGNLETLKSLYFGIDETAPHTIANFTASKAAQGVTVTLVATDNLSGVYSTTYQLDGGPVVVNTAPFNVTAAGNHKITFRSADYAGNLESVETAAFTVNAANTAAPFLDITKSHSGNFTVGQSGASYTIVVTNGGTGAASGTVTVTDLLPAGLTLVSMAGSGWNCSGTACTRSDALAANASYPAITVTVNVASNATGPVTNVATVAGSGKTNTASDLTQS
jgi:uncharacterized repeat protein (TIGR01451 family)